MSDEKPIFSGRELYLMNAAYKAGMSAGLDTVNDASHTVADLLNYEANRPNDLGADLSAWDAAIKAEKAKL